MRQVLYYKFDSSLKNATVIRKYEHYITRRVGTLIILC